MHPDGKSTLASVSKWNSGKVNLTGYHPPGLTPGPPIFSVKIPAPGQLFSAKLRPPGRENETKSPPRAYFLSSNVKISMKKEHNSVNAVSFQIFHNCPLTIFFYRENKVFKSLYTTLKINTV